MQLILWRHAEAEDVAANDLARKLTDKGEKQALKMAAWLRSQWGTDIGEWRVLSSPAIRAQQTAAALDMKVETVDSVAPDVPASSVLRAACWPDHVYNVVIVGHQPTLGMVAARLLNGVDGYVPVKKGSVWWFETRERDGHRQTVLKAMATPESLA